MRHVLVVSALLVGCEAKPPLPAPTRDADEPDAGASDAAARLAEDAGAADAGASDAGTLDAFDAGSGPDLDLDGLPDALETHLAMQYLPQLAVHPQDGCPLGGIAYRVRPHPGDPTLLLILYDHLFEKDCGAFGHTGDNEVFAVTVNPSTPGPAGITAMRAISHQKTACQKISTCGSCGTLTPCDPGDAGRPILYSSRGKHGSYALKAECQLLSICPEDCVASAAVDIPLVNVGEPDAHLVEDLTDSGFITTSNGWTKTELFHFDPWGPMKFGSAGKPSEDFPDEAFTPPACR